MSRFGNTVNAINPSFDEALGLALGNRSNIPNALRGIRRPTQTNILDEIGRGIGNIFGMFNPAGGSPNLDDPQTIYGPTFGAPDIGSIIDLVDKYEKTFGQPIPQNMIDLLANPDQRLAGESYRELLSNVESEASIQSQVGNLQESLKPTQDFLATIVENLKEQSDLPLFSAEDIAGLKGQSHASLVGQAASIEDSINSDLARRGLIESGIAVKAAAENQRLLSENLTSGDIGIDLETKKANREAADRTAGLATNVAGTMSAIDSAAANFESTLRNQGFGDIQPFSELFSKAGQVGESVTGLNFLNQQTEQQTRALNEQINSQHLNDALSTLSTFTQLFKKPSGSGGGGGGSSFDYGSLIPNLGLSFAVGGK